MSLYKLVRHIQKLKKQLSDIGIRWFERREEWTSEHHIEREAIFDVSLTEREGFGVAHE
jgi:hypothetical protein